MIKITIIAIILISILIVLNCYTLIFDEQNIYNIKNNTGDLGVDIINAPEKKSSIIFTDLKFGDSFDDNSIFEETGKMKESESLYWWVNSGAFFIQNKGVGMTLVGELEKGSKWQIEYKDYNSDETDNGFHPQNIFRLLTRSEWLNFNQEVYYKIVNYNLSKDSHRSESNGILLFNRYLDEDNLYYTGLRVDGTAVIKKKINGKYFTMDQKLIIDSSYDINKNPNLLPISEWIGVRSEVSDFDNNQVSIKVYYRFAQDIEWKLALEAIDDGKSYGGEAIIKSGYAGIRTDFMDVEFDNYKIEESI